MSTPQFIKPIIFGFLLLLTNCLSSVTAQEIIIYKNGMIENKCLTYNLSLSSNFTETKGISYNSKGIQSKEENAYLISKPVNIEINQPTPFLAFSYVFSTNKTPSKNINMYFSTSRDGEKYTPWSLLGIEISNDTAIYGELAFLDKSVKYLQYKIVFAKHASSIILKNIKISFINPGATNSNMQENINTTGKHLKTTMPNIIKRTEWGCSDGENAPLWPPQYTSVTHLVIHHTAGSNNTSQDYAATVRSIWSQHTYTNGWGDIGYNFLIDAYGRTYEGRAGGNNAIGAHCGFNTGTMGVSVMGTYTSTLPSDTALNTLKNILAWKCTDSHINPLGTAIHTSSGKNINTICGHKDIKSTECPGNAFYADLSDIRNKVNDLISIPIQTSNEISCYPNPFKETIKLDIKHINWSIFTIEITDIYGRMIYNNKINGFESGIISLNLSSLNNGIYFLRVITRSDILFNKTIIKSY